MKSVKKVKRISFNQINATETANLFCDEFKNNNPFLTWTTIAIDGIDINENIGINYKRKSIHDRIINKTILTENKLYSGNISTYLYV